MATVDHTFKTFSGAGFEPLVAKKAYVKNSPLSLAILTLLASFTDKKNISEYFFKKLLPRESNQAPRPKKRLGCALARRFTLSQNGYGTKLGWMVSISRL